MHTLTTHTYIQINIHSEMPAKRSSRTVRIRGLPTDLWLEDFKKQALLLDKAARVSKRRPDILSMSVSPIYPGAECSLAPQADAKTGIVTFCQAELKERAIKVKKDVSWEVDDIFDGLTVLYAADTVDLE